MTYTTTPGTLPHRAIAYMQTKPRGTEIGTAVLADALDYDANGFSSALNLAVKAGLMKCRIQNGARRMAYWSLGDGVPLVEPTYPEDEEVIWLEPKPLTGIPDVTTNIFQSKVKHLFCISELRDGSMVVETVGGTKTLEPQRAQEVRAFMAAAGCAA